MNTITEYYLYLKKTGTKEEISKFEEEWNTWCNNMKKES